MHYFYTALRTEPNDEKLEFWCNTWSNICTQGKTGVPDREGKEEIADLIIAVI